MDIKIVSYDNKGNYQLSQIGGIWPSKTGEIRSFFRPIQSVNPNKTLQAVLNHDANQFYYNGNIALKSERKALMDLMNFIKEINVQCDKNVVICVSDLDKIRPILVDKLAQYQLDFPHVTGFVDLKSVLAGVNLPPEIEIWTNMTYIFKLFDVDLGSVGDSDMIGESLYVAICKIYKTTDLESCGEFRKNFVKFPKCKYYHHNNIIFRSSDVDVKNCFVIQNSCKEVVINFNNKDI